MVIIVDVKKRCYVFYVMSSLLKYYIKNKINDQDYIIVMKMMDSKNELV